MEIGLIIPSCPRPTTGVESSSLLSPWHGCKNIWIEPKVSSKVLYYMILHFDILAPGGAFIALSAGPVRTENT